MFIVKIQIEKYYDLALIYHVTIDPGAHSHTNIALTVHKKR